MSQTLLIALAVSLPLAALAWLAALMVEASGAGLTLRLRAWTAAFLLPLAIAPAMLAIQALDIQSPLAWAHSVPQATQVEVFTPVAAPDLAIAPAQTAAASDATKVETPVRISPTALLLGLLAVGAALRLTGLALALRRVSRLAARSRPLAAALSDRLGRRVRQADTDAPILAGLVRPVILLPRALLDHLTVDQAALVCAHERAHLAAGDHLSHVLEEVIVRLFWFNPLLAMVRERLAATREEACDARALVACDDADRRVYAQTLITALKLAGEAQPVAAFTGFRRKGARRRLGAVLKPAGKGSPAAWLAAALAGLGLTGVLGGLSLALAAEPMVAQPAAAAPPSAPAPAPAAPAAAQAVPSTMPEPARRRRQTVITIQESSVETKDGADAHAQAAPKTRSWVFDDGAFAGFADLDPSHTVDLTPEDRERIAKAVEAARATALQAQAAGRLAAEDGRKRAEEGRKLGEEGRKRGEEARARAREQSERIHEELQANMRAWRVPGAPDADGKVLMRCSLKPDGSASDCQKVLSRFVVPPPPTPPKPPAPPALPPLPALPTAS
jgi:beta-lactamase regulating signal transducer with metallopeptidase domain